VKKEAITNNEIQGRYSELTFKAYGKLIVAPISTMPICNGVVPIRREKKALEGFKKKVKMIPRKIDRAALSIKIAIKRIKVKMK
tara:strand:+ start:433 stop:684 length:252 start_codon:yes stop_codon:yes gene_type:complete